jgi:VCBS repeat-containing protein
MVTPAQFRSSSPTALDGTLRLWQNMNFSLYYSNYLADNAAAAAPPAITHVSSTIGSLGPDNVVMFTVQVVGDPAAGMQQVWVTWTDISNPSGGLWQSIDLTQDPNDSRLWHGTLPLGSMTPADIRDHIRFIAQAVNGVGLVSSATNLCAYFIPGVDAGPTVPTALSPVSPASGSGPYGTQATFSAVLTSNGTPLSGQPVNFSLGPVSRLAITDGNGRATATLLLLGVPDAYEVQAIFAGTPTYIPSFSTGSFTITKQGTTLTLDPSSATGHRTADRLMVATLKDATGRPLGFRTVFFVVTGPGGSDSAAVITDYAGRAPLGDVRLPAGTYAVTVYFGGFIPIPGLPQPFDDVRYTSSTATGSLTLMNFPPVAVDHAYNVNEDQTLTVAAPGVLANDSDADQDSLTAVLVSGPTHGTLTLNANGSFVYAPTADYNGSDSFTYKANDGEADSNVATVSLTVNPVNDKPTANSQSVTTNEDTPVAITLTGSDAETSAANLAFTIVGGPSHGTLSGTAPNLTYTPASNYNGPDSFTFKVTDTGDPAGCTAAPCSPALDSNVATVSLTVNPVNDAPSFTAGPDQTVLEDAGAQTVTGWATNISAGPPDESSQTLTFVVTGNDNPGLFSAGPAVAADGTLTYTPAPDANGVAHITLVLKDSGGTANGGVDTSAPQTFAITVTPVNDPPVAANDAYSVNQGSTLTEAAPGVLGNDTDVDSPGLNAILVSSPAHGSLILNADGSFVYKPFVFFSGVDTFTYKANDGAADSNIATVAITVNALPACAPATASPDSLWPANNSFVAVSVTGPDGLTVIGIFQDEPVGKSPDGRIASPNTVELRADRDGSGDGRVYHIVFTDGSCLGEVKVPVVPHDQNGTTPAIDQGPLYDSTIPSP